jgi:hypothetical protein
MVDFEGIKPLIGRAIGLEAMIVFSFLQEFRNWARQRTQINCGKRASEVDVQDCVVFSATELSQSRIKGPIIYPKHVRISDKEKAWER